MFTINYNYYLVHKLNRLSKVNCLTQSKTIKQEIPFGRTVLF
jgi:hypothetical protein